MAATAGYTRLGTLRHPLVQPGCSIMARLGDEEDGIENECAPRRNWSSPSVLRDEQTGIPG